MLTTLGLANTGSRHPMFRILEDTQPQLNRRSIDIGCSSNVLLRVDLFHFSFHVVFIDLRRREVLGTEVLRGGYLYDVI